MTRKNILLLCLWMTALVSQAALSVTELKVEGLRSPLGIDTPTPRFSWQLKSDQRNVVQTAYEIVVCDAAGALMWNSGRVESPVPYGIKYEGTPLKSCSAYTWTVKDTTTDGKLGCAHKDDAKFLLGHDDRL